MRYLAAGLIYVTVATVIALFLGTIAGGLNQVISALCLTAGALAAVAAVFDVPAGSAIHSQTGSAMIRYRSIWLWLLGFVFASFAVRSFGWLLYFDGEPMRIQSPNNLGDLGLHITYIKTFANGTPLWPDSPLFVFSKLRYPAGMDLFNGVLTNLGIDLRHQLTVTGIVASAATFYALYKWSGAFGIAGFLFNGGLIGYRFFQTHQFLDYQGAPNIAWKSIALSMFVTQRGLLYAIPAGLLLLWHWRTKYDPDPEVRKQRLPIWIEYILYSSMPLFHVHTFLALSFVIACLFFTQREARRSLLYLVGSALVPASFFIYLITDNFHAGSILQWHPGWTQNTGEFAMRFVPFWMINFGVFLPLVLALVAMVSRVEWTRKKGVSIDAAYLAAAILMFLVVYFIKTAPWEWDNTKLLIWAYFITLPILWSRVICQWPLALQAVTCVALFFSGFVSLIGGLAAGRPGFEFANRAEVDFVGVVTQALPTEARFAAFPTYNHPLLLNGRKLVMGYEGHLWTQGIDYHVVAQKLRSLMLGQGDWLKTARDLEVRYLFWGREEAANYATSSRPWEKQLPLVAKGAWGSIYEFAPERGLTR